MIDQMFSHHAKSAIDIVSTVNFSFNFVIIHFLIIFAATAFSLLLQNGSYHHIEAGYLKYYDAYLINS